MKKLVLCGAVLTAMAMTACSTTNGSLAKPVVPVVEKVEVVDATENEKVIADLALVAGKATAKSYAMTVNGKAYTAKDFSSFGQGYHSAELKETVKVKNDKGQEEEFGIKGDLHLFQQGYSIIGARVFEHVIQNGKEEKLDEDHFHDFIKGQATKADALPKGSATYSRDEVVIYGPKNEGFKGKFTYTVNFDDKKGSGKIASINGHDIDLKETVLKEVSYNNAFDDTTSKFQGFQGDAERDGKSGNYTLGIFGPNADEVIGRVSVDDHEYDGFIGGKK